MAEGGPSQGQACRKHMVVVGRLQVEEHLAHLGVNPGLPEADMPLRSAACGAQGAVPVCVVGGGRAVGLGCVCVRLVWGLE